MSIVERNLQPLDALMQQIRGKLSFPQSDDFDTARAVWNGNVNRRPSVVVQCSGVADVMDAVNFAREQKLPLAVRGGGHSMLGHSVCDDGVVIDLSMMRSVWVDPVNRVAKVQGGARNGDVDRETQSFGLATTLGDCASVGVGGATLGGGFGFLRRPLGMTIDNLVGADVVTATGEYVHASETENADLFWALRGGGGNFGVVTSFDFKLHPVGPIVSGVHVLYDLDDLDQVIAGAGAYLKTASDNVGFSLIVLTIPPAPVFPEHLHFRKVVMVVGMYCGAIDEGKEALRPLRALATPLLDGSGPVPYRMLQSASEPLTPAGRRMCNESLFVSSFDRELGKVIRAQFNEDDHEERLAIIWATGGGKSAEIPVDHTAFHQRDTEALVTIEAILDGSSEAADAAQTAWVHAFYDALLPLSPNGGTTYLNLIGERGMSTCSIETAFGEQYHRLQEIKQKYDPMNLFRSNINIRPNEFVSQ